VLKALWGFSTLAEAASPGGDGLRLPTLEGQRLTPVFPEGIGADLDAWPGLEQIRNSDHCLHAFFLITAVVDASSAKPGHISGNDVVEWTIDIGAASSGNQMNRSGYNISRTQQESGASRYQTGDSPYKSRKNPYTTKESP
jgi:hypothetical protein